MLFRSSIFAAILALAALKTIAIRHFADIVLAILIIFFAMRFGKSRKFMPMGMMLIATVATLILRQLLS